MNYKTIVKGLSALSLAAVLGVPSAHAASGTTAVDVTFPPLIILYYFANIDVTVSEADLESLVTGNTGCSLSVTDDAAGAAELSCVTATDPQALGTSTGITGTTISYDANIGADGNVTAGLTDITVVLENSWAVRALTAGTLSAGIAQGAGDFVAATAAITPTAPTASMTLTDGQNIGDVQFDIDLETLAGLTASDTLTITISSP